MNNIYNTYFTLGAACQASCMLQDLELRKKAYPFDWIFNAYYSETSIQERVELLEAIIDNSVDSFLGSQSSLKFVKAIPQLTDNNMHYTYENIENNVMFSHDFIVSKQLNEKDVLPLTYDSIRYKYQRRCTRLKSLLLDKKKRVLAVWVSRPQDPFISIDQIQEAYIYLTNICNCTIHLLVLSHIDDTVGYEIDRPESGLIRCCTNYSRYSVYDANEINRIKTAAAFTYTLRCLQE